MDSLRMIARFGGILISVAVLMESDGCSSYEGISSSNSIKLRRVQPQTNDAPLVGISDVDKDIPAGNISNTKSIAIVLGVEKYRNLQSATYAKHDALIFKEYAVRVLGVPDDRNHLYMKIDDEVTKAEFDKLFSAEGWLAKRSEVQSDVYIYFSGHGAPDLKEKTPYLIPCDADPNYPSQMGYSLKKLYDEIGHLKARSVTIFLDVCFSGLTRQNTTLLAEARPMGISVVLPTVFSGDIASFTASGGDQIGSSYPSEWHGLFTYFLLKGLRKDADTNGDGSITVSELEDFLVTNVTRTAGQLDREQTPQVMTRNKQRVLVKY